MARTTQTASDYDITSLGSNTDISECIHCTVLFPIHYIFLWYFLFANKKTILTFLFFVSLTARIEQFSAMAEWHAQSGGHVLFGSQCGGCVSQLWWQQERQEHQATGTGSNNSMELEREKAIVRRRTWAGVYSNPKKDRNVIDHYFSRNLLFYCLLVARTKKEHFGQNRPKDTSIRKQWQIALWVCPKFWFPNPMVQNLQNSFVKSKWAISFRGIPWYTPFSYKPKYHVYVLYVNIYV